MINPPSETTHSAPRCSYLQVVCCKSQKKKTDGATKEVVELRLRSVWNDVT